MAVLTTLKEAADKITVLRPRGEIMKTKIALILLVGGAVSAALFAQEGKRTVWNGVYTKDQADKGKGFYARDCASCHGDSLGGGDVPPALVGGDFLSKWENVGSLFDRIRTTMPIGREGTLSRETNAAITAFILEANSFPAGEKALDTRSEMLNGIIIEDKK